MNKDYHYQPSIFVIYRLHKSFFLALIVIGLLFHNNRYEVASKRETIIEMHRAGTHNKNIAKSFRVSKSTAWNTVKCFKELRDFSDRVRSGRPRSQRIKAFVKVVRERVRRHLKRSIRKMIKE